ncbi:MAG: hypothetical protein AAGK00_06225 [Pseudomonadota bacterium]
MHDQKTLKPTVLADSAGHQMTEILAPTADQRLFDLAKAPRGMRTKAAPERSSQLPAYVMHP